MRAEHGFTHSYGSVLRFARKALAKKAQSSTLGSSWSEPTLAAKAASGKRTEDLDRPIGEGAAGNHYVERVAARPEEPGPRCSEGRNIARVGHIPRTCDAPRNHPDWDKPCLQ